MNNEMAISTYLSTIESKKQNKQAELKPTDRTFSRLPDQRGIGDMGEKGEGIKKHRLVVTEQSQGCKVQHREYSR